MKSRSKLFPFGGLLFGLLVFLAAGFGSRNGWSYPQNDISLRTSAQNLSKAEVNELENTLQSDPGHMSARKQLVIFYFHNRSESGSYKKAYLRHVLWLIEHRPASDFSGSVYVLIRPDESPEKFDQASALWEQHMQSRPNNAKIISNAASFFGGSGKEEKQVSLLKNGQSLEPKRPRWPRRLGKHYRDRYRFSDVSYERRKTLAQKALEYFIDGLDLAQDAETQTDLLRACGQTALMAGKVDQARKFAKRFMEKAESGLLAAWGGNPDVRHQAHTLMGRIDLRQGKVDDAKQHLLASGDVRTSPTLSSFGPSMRLAHDLLNGDHHKIVIQYLEKIRSFWMHKDTVDRWIEQIEAGKEPDFGHQRWQ